MTKMHDDNRAAYRELNRVIADELRKGKHAKPRVRRVVLPKRLKPQTRAERKRLAAMLAKMREVYRP